MQKYLFNNKLVFVLYFVLSVATYVCVTGIYGMYSLITKVTENKDYGQAYAVVGYSAGILVALLILLMISAIIKRIALTSISCSLRKDIFDKVYQMNMLSFYQKDSTYYTSMVVNDVTILEDSYFANVFEFIGDMIQLFVMLFAITLVGWKYTVIVGLFAILSAVQPFVVKKQLAKRGAEVSGELQSYTSRVKEYVQSFELINSFSKSPIFLGLFNQKADELECSNKRLWNAKLMNSVLLLLSVYVLKVGAQLFFAHSAIAGLVSVATVSLLFGLANNVGNPIASLLAYIEPIHSTKDIRKKVEEFLEDEGTEEREEGLEIQGNLQEIEFNEVAYSYDGEKQVLDHLNLSFEAGKKYALVGESGCGKSTILKLIMGYYGNYNGHIIMNGEEVRTLDIHGLREQIAYLTQNAFLFMGTLQDNITLNDDEYTKEQIDEVISYVELDELIKKLPLGLKQEIESCSKNFSGGEKQRIAMARALLRENQVILMDESASALDNLTASVIEKRMLKDKGKMVISVIHRFNESIKYYDCIYYLENGRLCEAGTYKELMESQGKFYSMISKQEGKEDEEN